MTVCEEAQNRKKGASRIPSPNRFVLMLHCQKQKFASSQCTTSVADGGGPIDNQHAAGLEW